MLLDELHTCTNPDCSAKTNANHVDLKQWIVHLGDGTWVLLDELPTVVLLTEKQIDEMDEFPLDCMLYDHIHIRDLVELSSSEGHPSMTERL